jgi:hypothetical protein
MKSLLLKPKLSVLFLTIFMLPASQAIAADGAAHNAKLAITHADFHGWKSIIIRNRVAEVVIVPEIGRIMEFGLLDDKGDKAELRSPFWNHPGVGVDLKSDSQGWTNYGGDKAWPSPQSNWLKILGKDWPPPKGFDFFPFKATVKGNVVEILSSIDPSFGIRVRRTIVLDPHKPVMHIETEYEKVQGAPMHVGVWTITQLDSPERAFIRLPPHFAPSEGYVNFLPAPPKDLRLDGQLLSLTRDSGHDTMIGTQGDALLWVGDNPDLLIEDKTPQPPEAKAERPDKGSHAKIYTNGGDLKYVELELLEPLHDLKPGENTSMSTTYTLIKRSETDPVREAQKVFALH